MGKVTGVIERWNPGRGFGFLKPEDGGEEVFFHASEFKGEERDIRNGDTFEFEVEYDKRKGKDRAMNVCNTSAPGGRDRSRSRSRGGGDKGGRGRDESVDSRFEDDLKDYIKDNDLDESAEDRLRACPPHICKKVMEEGDLKEFRNPSSMVMSRISNAKGGGKGGGRKGGKGKGRGRGRSRSYDRYDRRDRSYDRGYDRGDKGRDRSYSRGRRDRSYSRGRY